MKLNTRRVLFSAISFLCIGLSIVETQADGSTSPIFVGGSETGNSGGGILSATRLAQRAREEGIFRHGQVLYIDLEASLRLSPLSAREVPGLPAFLSAEMQDPMAFHSARATDRRPLRFFGVSEAYWSLETSDMILRAARAQGLRVGCSEDTNEVLALELRGEVLFTPAFTRARVQTRRAVLEDLLAQSVLSNLPRLNPNSSCR